MSRDPASPGGRPRPRAPAPPSPPRGPATDTPHGPPRLLSTQLLVGFGVGLLAVLVDTTVAAVRGARDPGLDAVLRGMVHLAGLYLPLGVALGLAVGLALGLLDRTPWLAPVRARLGGWERWRRSDPEATAGVLGALLGGLGWALAVWRMGVYFTTRFHRPELAFALFAALALGLIFAGVLLASAATVVALPVLARLRPLARPFVPVAASLVGGVTALAVVLARNPRWLRVLPIELYLAPALVVLAYLVLALGRRRLPAPRRLRGRRTVDRLALGSVVGAIAFGVLTAFSYGGSSRVRTAVERRSLWGLPVLRQAAVVFDRDGDGRAPVFGGGDCNDRDPKVFPGAPDPPGDGVDADCFAGDGTPSLTLLSDGEPVGRPPTALPGVDRPSFLLITVDALRPDHLGAWGYDRATSPNLDQFAARSVRFVEAVATSSRSIRSIPSMLTGRYPSQIAYGPEYLFPSLSPSNVTLAETLQEAGWRTAVVMGTDYFVRSKDFFQGFDEVIQSRDYRPRRSWPVDRGMAQLAELAADPEARPFFLWVHLFNVHEPYLWDRRPSRFGDQTIDRYDTEIFLADQQIGRLLRALAASPAAERTVTVLASDHGEAFGEHGSSGHSYTLYEEELRAPLLIHVPGLAPGEVEDTVGLHDLTPTVLDLAGVPTKVPVAGRSLLRHLQDAAGTPGTLPGTPPGRGAPGGPAAREGPRMLFAELMPDGLLPFDRRAIRVGDLKLHWWLRDGTYELYDLGKDPGETRDLSDARPDAREELLSLLRRYVAANALPEHRRAGVVDDNRLRRPPEELDHRLDLRFPGRFEVLGYDLPKRTFRKGERIPITFYYRVTGRMSESLFFEVSFEPPGGLELPPHFHGGHYPLDGRYLTREWRPGEILRDPLSIIIPETLRTPVDLTLRFAVFADGRMVPHAGGASRVTLTDVEIR